MSEQHLVDRSDFDHALRDALATAAGISSEDINCKTPLYTSNPGFGFSRDSDPIPRILDAVATQKLTAKIWPGDLQSVNVPQEETYCYLLDAAYSWLDDVGQSAVMQVICRAIPNNNALPNDPLSRIVGGPHNISDFIGNLQVQTQQCLLDNARFSQNLQNNLSAAKTIGQVYSLLANWIHDHIR